MGELKEIKPQADNLVRRSSNTVCPNCDTMMYYGAVGCPDGKPGCLVLHYGYTCPACGKQWT